MDDELRLTMNKMGLQKLLRYNISCYQGRTLTQELCDEITDKMIESLDYFLNKRE